MIKIQDDLLSQTNYERNPPFKTTCSLYKPNVLFTFFIHLPRLIINGFCVASFSPIRLSKETILSLSLVFLPSLSFSSLFTIISWCCRSSAGTRARSEFEMLAFFYWSFFSSENLLCSTWTDPELAGEDGGLPPLPSGDRRIIQIGWVTCALAGYRRKLKKWDKFHWWKLFPVWEKCDRLWKINGNG